VAAGTTNANDLPVTGGVYSTKCGCSRTGTQDAVSAGFIAKFSPDGAKLVWSTFLPIQRRSLPFTSVTIRTLAIDGDDNVVVAGSAPDGFPVTPGSLQTAYPGTQNLDVGAGFVTKLDKAAAHLVFSTYFGDTRVLGGINVASVAIDSTNNIWLTGESRAAALPASLAPVLGPGYVASLSPDGSTVSTFLTAPEGAVGREIAVDARGRVAVLGSRGSFLLSSAEGAPSIVGVMNAAGDAISPTVSPVEIVSLYGYALGSVVPLPAQVSGGVVAASLNGYKVLFNGLPAPLLSVSSNQIDCIIPSSVALATQPGTASIQIVTPQGTFSGPTLFLARSQPQTFHQADGFARALNEDGTVNSTSAPAAPGSIVTIWATGSSSTLASSGRADGAIVTPNQLGSTALPVSIFSNLESPVAAPLEVLYAGDAPNEVWGVSQINFRLPGSFNPNAVPVYVRLQVGSSISDPVSLYVHP
jgi:uncharacterized protein (TIGR03437 family)